MKTYREKLAGKTAWEDDSDWAFDDEGENTRRRETVDGYEYDIKKAKLLAECLRSAMMALGHVISAQNKFTKMKSVQISPDGKLGGMGYVRSITDMRRQFANCAEALSSLSDTLYDELNAEHWQAIIEDVLPDDEQAYVEDVIDDVEIIREDPEDWAEDMESEEDV